MVAYLEDRADAERSIRRGDLGDRTTADEYTAAIKDPEFDGKSLAHAVIKKRWHAVERVVSELQLRDGFLNAHELRLIKRSCDGHADADSALDDYRSQNARRWSELRDNCLFELRR